MGPVGSNGENGGRGAQQFPATNHRKVGAGEHGQEMGDTGGGGREGISGEEFSRELQWVALRLIFEVFA